MPPHRLATPTRRRPLMVRSRGHAGTKAFCRCSRESRRTAPRVSLWDSRHEPIVHHIEEVLMHRLSRLRPAQAFLAGAAPAALIFGAGAASAAPGAGLA